MNNSLCYLLLCTVFSFVISGVYCWTDEDLELFDLVESTDRKFYDILGVDQKASASDIRKAYRKLSQIYHPDRNDAPDAEETFRKIAAIADVLRNEEQRKKYDVILQTGLPDWREPIYYYRRVRNMGLIDLMVFLFCLATVAQYLFAWSAYWEKKYEMEELMSSKLKKKTKHQKKGRGTKVIEEFDASCDIILPKPRCQDLFPVRLVLFFVHTITSIPSYSKSCYASICSYFQKREIEVEEEEIEPEPEVRVRIRKHVKHQQPQYPELPDSNYSDLPVSSNGNVGNHVTNGTINGSGTKGCKSSHLTEADMAELKKAMKKFPHGTLQRWEKIASYLDCTVSEVVSMAKQMKSQEFARNKLMLLTMQGISGVHEYNEIDNNCTIHDEYELNGTAHPIENGFKHVLNGNGIVSNNGDVPHENDIHNSSEKIWKQEEQRMLELALQKFPKDTPARWDQISRFVQSKTKEECVMRYKELAQQVKKKKGKEN